MNFKFIKIVYISNLELNINSNSGSILLANITGAIKFIKINLR